MAVEWGDLVRPGSEEEHRRFWQVLAAALVILLGVLLFEAYTGERVDDGICVEAEVCGPRSVP